MKKTIALLVVVCALTVGSSAFGAIVGNFENSMDGWVPGAGAMNLTATGATAGSSALDLVVPGGWNIAIKQIDAWKFAPIFGAANSAISMDITLRNDNNSIPAWWFKSNWVLNAQHIGWVDLGEKDTSISWGPSTTTYTWQISDAVRQTIAGAASFGYFEILYITNTGASANIQIDNIQFVPEPVSLSLLGLGSALFLRRK